MSKVAERAAAYLAGEGRSMVLRQLRSLGLPASLFDDLVQDTLERVLVASARGEKPRSLEAFVSTVCRRAAIDALRGKVRRPTQPLASSTDSASEIDPPDTDAGPELLVIDRDELARLGEAVDELRRHLERRLGDPAPARAAAALAVVAIAHGDAEPADDCPRPKKGVDPAESTSWAGLFYGGEPRCFPTDADPEDAAMRKRRSRALDRVRHLLLEASGDLADILDGDDA